MLNNIKSIKIEKLWGEKDLTLNINEKLTIINGKNGSGKSTILTLIDAVINLEFKKILFIDFKKIEIKFKDAKLIVEKIEQEGNNNRIGADYEKDYDLKYKIMKKDEVILEEEIKSVARITERYHIRFRNFDISILENLKIYLSKITTLKLINPEIFNNGYKSERREYDSSNSLLDIKLSEALLFLEKYRISLSNKISEAVKKFQHKILISALLDVKNKKYNKKILDNFNQEKELNDTLKAYEELGLSTDEIKEKIKIHVKILKDAVENLLTEPKKSKINDLLVLPFIEKNELIRKEFLKYTKEKDEIMTEFDRFLSSINSFIEDKDFNFNIDKNNLEIRKKDKVLDVVSLSTGEKQLLLIFINTLYMDKKNNILIIDEPEISLHPGWQREIVQTLRKINPNMQLIIATHSIEISSKHAEYTTFIKGDSYNGV